MIGRIMSLADLKLDSRGGRGRGSGRASGVHVPPIHRGSARHVAQLNPWGVGSTLPTIGAPLGRVQQDHGTGTTVNCDPINWFNRAKLLLNPSEFILGLPHMGKSTVVRRQVLYYAGTGVIPLVLGDLKPDYVDLIAGLGGQVIRLGRGVGTLNILDMGDAPEAARLMSTAAGRTLLQNAKARRQLAVESLFTIQRGTSPTDTEVSLLNQALVLLDKAWGRRQKQPILSDLLALIQSAPDTLRTIAQDHGELTKYHAVTEALISSLIALTQEGGLGDVFNAQTKVRMRRDIPAVIDIHTIDEADEKLRGAALVASWAYGFGQVAVSNALADEGIEPQRNYFVVMDELWMALRQGKGLVGKVDALSRLNRQKGVGVAMISHTMEDLKALPSAEDRAMAEGLVARAGMVICGGLPPSEMPRLQTVMRVSKREQALLSSWSTPASWSPTGDSRPPGQGFFLIKVGGRPGIPFEFILTEAEKNFGNTNKRWAA